MAHNNCSADPKHLMQQFTETYTNLSHLLINYGYDYLQEHLELFDNDMMVVFEVNMLLRTLMDILEQQQKQHSIQILVEGPSTSILNDSSSDPLSGLSASVRNFLINLPPAQDSAEIDVSNLDLQL